MAHSARNCWRVSFAVALLSSLIVTPGANADLPKIMRLSARPARVELGGIRRQQQLVITGTLADGREVDLTGVVSFEVTNDRVASVADATIRGLSDGSTHVVVRHESRSVRVPIQVTKFDDYPSLEFRTDILPVLSKLGCNSGGCHGKQGGQNGFQLSIFGFDPRSDHEALVMQGRGRRIFPSAPRRSLLLTKATAQVPHGGGQRTTMATLDAELLVEWIRQGSPWGSGKAARLTGIQVFPEERVMRTQAGQQLLVTAVYSDGSKRDVTPAAAYTSNAAAVCDVDQLGRVKTGTVAGEAAITINYMGQVAVSRFLVPRQWDVPRVVEKKSQQPIDQLVARKLAKLGIRPSGVTDDASFLRRLYVTTIGVLPTAEEARRFVADKRVDKRRRAIEAILDREEFADYWAVQWADILLVDPQRIGERGAYAFHTWLRKQFAEDRPYDQWVRELVTATGNSAKYEPVNLYRAQRTPEDLTKTISQAFLGIRLDCAQCHHHPFEKWGQDDFYGMAGYFTGIERKSLAPQREFVFHAGHKPARMPVSNKIVSTRPPDGPMLQPALGEDPRVPLANWMTSSSNPFFSRLVANRIWKHLLGRGLFEPEDDLRSTNPSSNEPLLKYLAQQVVTKEFRLKSLIREILLSETFQRSSETNSSNFDDEQNFSHYLKRRLSAHVLLDAISQTTGTPERFPGHPLGTRAMQLWDNRLPSYFLDTFGRSLRMSPCACGKSDEPTMAQALHLMNAPEIQAKIESASGRVSQLLRAKKNTDAIVDELCLTALGRAPRSRERRMADKMFSSLPKEQAAQDFLWVLMNSYDFLFIR